MMKYKGYFGHVEYDAKRDAKNPLARSFEYARIDLFAAIGRGQRAHDLETRVFADIAHGPVAHRHEGVVSVIWSAESVGRLVDAESGIAHVHRPAPRREIGVGLAEQKCVSGSVADVFQPQRSPGLDHMAVRRVMIQSEAV